MIKILKYFISTKKLFYNLILCLKEICIALILSFVKKFEKKVKYDKCVIVGNGPSFHDSLKKIKCEDVDYFVVNSFNLSEYFLKIKPSNYIILDPGYLNLSSNNDLNERIKKTITDLNKVNWDINLFLPLYPPNEYFDKNIFNSKIKIQKYSNYPFKSMFKNFFVSKRLGILGGKNVLTAAISIALVKNYKTLYLIGADHSWLEEVGVDNIGTYQELKHSYNELKLNRNYHKKDELAKGLISLGNLLLSYYELNSLAEVLGKEIIQLDEKTYIDAFK